MNLSEIWPSLTIGLFAAFSPCVFPLYPGFLAYLSGAADRKGAKLFKYTAGFFVLAGVLTMMVIIGFIISLIAIPTGEVLKIIIPVSDLIIIILGLLLLLNINIFKAMPTIRIPVLSNPYLNAYIYGFLYGPIALPCSGPFLVAIFTYSLTITEIFSKLGIFFWFGMGFGIPLLIISLLAGATQKWVTRFLSRHNRVVNLIGGVLLIGVAIFDLWINWELLFA